MREGGHLVVFVSCEEEPRQHEEAEGLRQQTPNRHHLPGTIRDECGMRWGGVGRDDVKTGSIYNPFTTALHMNKYSRFNSKQ